MASYKRNPEAVKKQLVENASGEILTKVNCKIQIPKRFVDRGLGEAGITTFSYGCFPIILVDTNEYSLLNINALIELNPSKTTPLEIDEEEYIEFYFDANTVVIKSTTLVRRDTMMFNVFDEFVFKGKIPWYVDYTDLGKLFDTADIFAGSNVGKNPEVIEFIASMITRPKSDFTKYLRATAKSYADTESDKIGYVPLSSVYYSVNSTVNKIAGAYFQEGVVSALVTPSKEVQKIEKILRA
jgi:hypothetical protein